MISSSSPCNLSSDDPSVEQYFSLREKAGFLTLHDFKVIKLTGGDRLSWLQGQATNDLLKLGESESADFYICKPTGQIFSMGRLWNFPDHFLLVMDSVSAKNFLKRCNAAIILEDVQPSLLQHTVVTLQGPSSDQFLSDVLGKVPTSVGFHEGVCYLRSPRIDQRGWDFLIPPSCRSLLDFLAEYATLIYADVFQVACLESGIPKMGVDVTDKTLPPELGLAFKPSQISYTKGCYTGQEVLMRIHCRGHTNLTWALLQAEGPIEQSAVVSHPKFSNAGKITQSVWSPKFGYIAGAFLRNEVASADEEVTVKNAKNELKAKVHVTSLCSVLEETH